MLLILQFVYFYYVIAKLVALYMAALLSLLQLSIQGQIPGGLWGRNFACSLRNINFSPVLLCKLALYVEIISLLPLERKLLLL